RNILKQWAKIIYTLLISSLLIGCKSHPISTRVNESIDKKLNPSSSEFQNVWQIGLNDNIASDFAMGPAGYKDFLKRDFGYEDKYFLIGHSKPLNDFPYVLPGPADSWGGTGKYAGWRTHEINILFGIKDAPSQGSWKLVVDLVDSSPQGSLVKVTINDQHKKFDLKGLSDSTLVGKHTGTEKVLEIPIEHGILKKGGNRIT